MAQHSSNSDTSPALSLVAKGFTSLARPFLDLGGAIIHTIIPEEGNDFETGFDERAVEAGFDDRLSLEGTLYHRKGKSTGRTPWKRRLVVLDFEHGGSLSVFQIPKNDPTKMIKQMYTKIHRSLSISGGNFKREGQTRDLIIHLPSDVPWTVKDVNDSSSFLVEIPTNNRRLMESLGVHCDVESLVDSYDADQSDDHSDDGSATLKSDLHDSMTLQSSMSHSTSLSLANDFETARKKRKPVRFYFQCPRKDNEKTLWLRAFAKLARLSSETRRKNFVFETIGQLTMSSSRIRTDTSAQFLLETRQLEMGTMNAMRSVTALNRHDEVEALSRNNVVSKTAGGPREFRVTPTYCYPHTWMTREEMKEEANLPSSTFHDLRIHSQAGQEIGTLRVEVLSCLGLPKLDRTSETDAVVYLVCGAHAFATDVIPDTKNPIWLRKTRRACIFPVYHGFARLYLGVFDDDGKGRDLLAGRVVIDIARLRPGSEYDIILPLRLSTHVYSRQPRGVIRLRFQLDWTSERSALLSYIPRTLKLRNFQPRYSTTIACTNASSFRNVAITVHGSDLPGKFSFNHFKAVIREMNFTRKTMILILRMTIKNTITWVNPAMSAFVFFAWMHCVYMNSFSLVPAYFMSFLLLHMIRNYAIYGIDGPASRGFLPPTWEEMFLALIRPSGTHNIEPIEMTTQLTIGITSQPRSDAASIDTKIPRIYNTTKTHEPIGKPVFRALGFLEAQEELDGMTPDERHLEFPFARGSDYPKHLVKDSLAFNVAKKEKSKGKQNKDSALASPPGSLRTRLGSAGHLHKQKDDTTADMSNLEVDEEFPSFDEDDSETLVRKARDGTPPSTTQSYDEDDTPNPLRTRANLTEIPYDHLPPYLRIPEQDIDRQGPSTGTKLTDDMAEIKEQMHKFTCHLFNDKTHVIKQANAVYFGSTTKHGAKKRKHDVDTDLQRLLQVGQYSHANPIVSRIGQYLEPLVGGAQAWLCGCRACFNIYTWRDPFLSFWISLWGIVTVAILFVFPWRLFLLGVGLIVVGPQNLIFRWLKERREQSKPPPLRSRIMTNDEVSILEDFPEDQPLFAGHPAPNQHATPIDRDHLDAREVHHVVVPYSRLMYQRFYDWPPEAAYAQVKKKPPQIAETEMQNKPKNHTGSIVEIDTPVLSIFRDTNSEHSVSREIRYRSSTKNKNE